MNCSGLTSAAPESLHPSLWLASQLARGAAQCVDTGHAALSSQLPGGGWPAGVLVDLLQQQPGIGEMRLLRPALARVATRRIVLLQPPHPPQALALAALGMPPSQLIWLRASRTVDALCVMDEKKSYRKTRRKPLMRVCGPMGERRGLSLSSG
jgi:protein ImuA